MSKITYELIAVNHHKNNIALFRCKDSDKIFYLKTSLSNNGNKVILKEHAGYQYFFSKIAKGEIPVFSSNYFHELRIPYYKGLNVKSESGITGNEEIIEKVVSHYTNRWLIEDSKLVIHGDLVLSNVILDDESIFLIDWEHFHKTKPEYWGYDIIHLLYVAVHYNSGHLTYDQKEFLRGCYRSLCRKASVSNQILEKPFQNIQKYFLEHKILFAENYNTADKFIIANAKKNELELLDLMLTKTAITNTKIRI